MHEIESTVRGTRWTTTVRILQSSWGLQCDLEVEARTVARGADGGEEVSLLTPHLGLDLGRVPAEEDRAAREAGARLVAHRAAAEDPTR